MANKYVVIAGGNSNADATWTLNADGTTNATTVPTSSDDILINSTAGNLVINAALACRSFDMTGYTGTLSGSGALTLTGPAYTVVCLFAGTVTWTGLLTLNPASGGTINLTAAGKLSACTALTINGAGTVSLQDNITIAKTVFSNKFLIVAGTFTTNNYNITAGQFGTTGTNAKTLNLGTSTITVGIQYQSAVTMGSSAYITLDATNATFIINTPDSKFSPGTLLAYGTVSFTGAGANIIDSTTTIDTLNVTATASQTCSLQIYNNITINTALNLNGNSAINRLLIQSNTIGTARTITLGASATCASVSNYVDFQDITLSGGAANERDFQTNSKSAGDCGGNSGITFTTAADQTWSGATGNWSNSALWTSRIPLPQDNVILPNPGATSRTITADMPRLGHDITVTNAVAANKFTLGLTNQNVAIYGSLTLVDYNTYMVASANKSFYFAGRSNATINTAGNTIGHYCYIYAYGATVSLLSAVSFGSGINVYNGNFVSNGYSITSYGISTYGSDCTVDISNSTCTLLVLGNSVNRPFTTTGSTIILTSASTGSFAGGTQTFNDIQLNPGTGVTTFSGAFTFRDMRMSAAGVKTIKFTKSTTYTMTGSSFLSGTSGAIITIDNNDASATNFTLNKSGGGIISSDYLKINHSTATPGTTWYAGANSTDDGANSGWTFTAPPANVSIDAVLATSTAAFIIPGVVAADGNINASINATTAIISASSLDAVISGSASISNAQAMIDSAGLIPTISGSALIASMAASNTVSSPSMTVVATAVIQAIIAEAVASAYNPAIAAGSNVAVLSTMSTANAQMLAAEYAASASITTAIADALSECLVTGYSSSSKVFTDLAEIVAEGLPASVSTEVKKKILQRFNKLFGPRIGP